MNEGEGEKEGWGERRREGEGGEGGEEERRGGGEGGKEERGGEEERRRGGRGTVPSCGFLFLNLFNLFEHF